MLWHAKSCGYCWELDIVINFKELGWEAQSQTTPQRIKRYRPACEAVTHRKRVQWSCMGAKEQDLTRADTCTLRWDPNSEDLLSPPSFQQLKHFQGEYGMQKTMGWGQKVVTPRLTLVHRNWETAFSFAWLTTSYVFSPSKVFQLMETQRHGGETVQNDPALLKATSASYKANCHGK